MIFTKGETAYYLELQSPTASLFYITPMEDAQSVVDYIMAAVPSVTIKQHGQVSITEQDMQMDNRVLPELDAPTDSKWKINFLGNHSILVDGKGRYSSRLIQLAKGEIPEVVETPDETVIQEEAKQSAKASLAEQVKQQAKEQEQVVVTGPVNPQTVTVPAGPGPVYQKEDAKAALRAKAQASKPAVTQVVVGSQITTPIVPPASRTISPTVKQEAFNPQPGVSRTTKMDLIYNLMLEQKEEIQELRNEVQRLTQALYQ